jgi:hypothetical protein
MVRMSVESGGIEIEYGKSPAGPCRLYCDVFECLYTGSGSVVGFIEPLQIPAYK